MVDVGRDIVDIFTIGDHRPDIYEIFGGHGAITYHAVDYNLTAARPRDYVYGDDLREPTVRREVLDDLYWLRPRVVVIGWPCRYWGSLTKINFRGPEGRQRLRRLRRLEMPFLHLTEEACHQQQG